jgi:hypothetical protein
VADAEEHAAKLAGAARDEAEEIVAAARLEARRVLDEARETAVRLTREVVAEIAHIRQVAVEATAPPRPTVAPAPPAGPAPAPPPEVDGPPLRPDAGDGVGAGTTAVPDDDAGDETAADASPAPPVPVTEPRPGFFRRLFGRG